MYSKQQAQIEIDHFNELSTKEDKMNHLDLVLGKCRAKVSELHALKRSIAILEEKIKSQGVTPYEIALSQDSDLLEKHVAALQTQIDIMEDEDTFYEWMGHVYNLTKGQRIPAKTNDENDDLIENDIIREVEAMLSKVRLTYDEMKPLRVEAKKQWKKQKAELGDAEYRRKKHKFTALAAKMDKKFPSFTQKCKEAEVAYEKEWKRKAMPPLKKKQEETPTAAEDGLEVGDQLIQEMQKVVENLKAEVFALYS